jgi:hypothetical protein
VGAAGAAGPRERGDPRVAPDSSSPTRNVKLQGRRANDCQLHDGAQRKHGCYCAFGP